MSLKSKISQLWGELPKVTLLIDGKTGDWGTNLYFLSAIGALIALLVKGTIDYFGWSGFIGILCGGYFVLNCCEVEQPRRADMPDSDPPELGIGAGN